MAKTKHSSDSLKMLCTRMWNYKKALHALQKQMNYLELWAMIKYVRFLVFVCVYRVHIVTNQLFIFVELLWLIVTGRSHRIEFMKSRSIDKTSQQRNLMRDIVFSLRVCVMFAVRFKQHFLLARSQCLKSVCINCFCSDILRLLYLSAYLLNMMFSFFPILEVGFIYFASKQRSVQNS